MADKASLSKARQQLEDLYLGIPDDSVDLTLKDFASYQREDPKVVHNMEPIREERSPGPGGSRGRALKKVPSIDFVLAVEEAREHHRRVEQKLYQNDNGKVGSRVATAGAGQQMFSTDVSRGYGTDHSQLDERVGGRRPGIPHSHFCALCSDYVYIFRHRCLVCGRVYCRKCVGAGMGEMTEGRKCVECLGRRFSQRYIQKAGQAGCCWRYPSSMKQQELKWAEKGPKRSGERRYGRSDMVSRSRSPVMPRTPERSYVGENSPSFVTNSPSLFTTNPHRFPI